MERNRQLTLGSFDFLKGISIIMVIFGHTFGQASIINNLYIKQFINCVGQTSMICLFMIMAFGIRKSPISLSIKREANIYLKIYILVAILTLILYFPLHLVCYKDFNSAVVNTLRIFVGLITGESYTHYLFGHLIYSGGIMWFFVTAALSNIIVSSVLYYVKENFQKYVILLLLIVGIALSYLNELLPFCIVQSLICSFFVYAGYIVKTKKLLFINPSIWTYILFIISFIITYLSLSSVAECYYSFDIITIFSATIFAYFLIIFSLIINSRNNIIVDVMEKIGNISIYVICIHAIDYMSLPWDYIINKFNSNSYLCFFIVLSIRVLFMLLGLLIVKKKKQTDILV